MHLPELLSATPAHRPLVSTYPYDAGIEQCFALQRSSSATLMSLSAPPVARMPMGESPRRTPAPSHARQSAESLPSSSAAARASYATCLALHN